VRCFCAVAIAAAIAVWSAPAATAQTRPRVFILWLDGTTLQDWNSPALPNFRTLLKDGSLALLSTRTEHESADPAALRANAAATFSAGALAAMDPKTGNPIPEKGATPGLLGEAIAQGGYRMLVLGDADSATVTDRNAARALARLDGTVPQRFRISDRDPDLPGGRSSVATLINAGLATFQDAFDVFLIDPGDTARVARAGSPDDTKALAMLHANLALDALRPVLKPTDTLMVVSASVPVERQREGIRLGFVAISGPLFGRGELTSPTTRRDGIITTEDLAPTIASILGLKPLDGAEGRAATFVPRSGAALQLAALEGDLIQTARDRRPLTRWTLIGSMILVGITLPVALWRRPNPGRDRRIPRNAQELLATLLIAAAATPLALYVNGAFYPESTKQAAWETLAVSLGLAVAARAFLRFNGALALVLSLTALIPLIDILLGTPLGMRSPLAFQIAGGGRFYGVDDGVLGVVVGAEIFAAALILERAHNPRFGPRLAALVFAVSVWLLGAPSYGAKFGAALTAVPAFGVLAWIIAGRRFTWRAIAGIAIATLAVTGLLIGVDAVRSSESQTHVARAVEGRSSVSAIISRKVHAQWQIGAHTIWLPAILVFTVAILLVLWRRRDRVGGEWHPMLKPALLAAGVGGVAGIAFNDGGVITTAPIALFAACVTFSTMLNPG
jgi:hypothetical protein